MINFGGVDVSQKLDQIHQPPAMRSSLHGPIEVQHQHLTECYNQRMDQKCGEKTTWDGAKTLHK